MPDATAHHGLFQDTNLHVDDTGGSGRPVVLIHGWPLSGEAWQEQVPVLAAAGYRVITYDRHGFGRSNKSSRGYTYDSLAEDLESLLVGLDVRDVTLVGFSMGGGEVARYVSRYGERRLRSIVFASAVPPYLMHTDDNPDGPLEPSAAAAMTADLTRDADSFYDQFTTNFFSADGKLEVTEQQRLHAVALCRQADKHAALACMNAFGTTDFRDDLLKVSVPTLILHGAADAIVPYEGSGARTHQAIPASTVHVVPGAPHGVNVSHAPEWNRVLLTFLEK